MKTNVLNGWTCTDPDNLQFRKKNSETEFEFREFRMDLLNCNIADTMQYINDKIKLTFELFAEKYWENTELWVTQIVDTSTYSNEQITEFLDAYGYEYEDGEVVYPNGDSYKDIALIAECIFELETQY